MSGVTGNWVLMSHETDMVFWRDFGCVALDFTIKEQEIERQCISAIISKIISIFLMNMTIYMQ